MYANLMCFISQESINVKLAPNPNISSYSTVLEHWILLIKVSELING